MGSSFFVTGTGTDVGKTFFSALFLAKYAKTYGYRYWKPVQTGISEGSDTDFLKRRTGLPNAQFLEPLYQFSLPASPHLAANEEKKEVDPKRILEALGRYKQNPLLIEGAGGVNVPLNETYLFIKLLQEANLGVVLVGSTELGTINHTLLSLEALSHRFIPVLGFYLVGPKNRLADDNVRIIQKMSGFPWLGTTYFPDQNLSPEQFTSYANEEFDTKRNTIELLLETVEDDYL